MKQDNNQNLLNTSDMVKACLVAVIMALLIMPVVMLALELAPLMFMLAVAVIVIVDAIATFGKEESLLTFLMHTAFAICTALYATYNNMWNGWTDSYVSEIDHQYYSDEYTSTLWVVIYGIFAVRVLIQLINAIVIYLRKRKGA